MGYAYRYKVGGALFRSLNCLGEVILHKCILHSGCTHHHRHGNGNGKETRRGILEIRICETPKVGDLVKLWSSQRNRVSLNRTAGAK
jgi:hypothetical protein